MSESELNIIDDAGEAVDEMTVLKERAKDLGLRISPKIGLEKLREKVNNAMLGNAEEDPEEEVTEDQPAAPKNKADEDWSVDELRSMPKVKREQIIRRIQKKEEMRLMRCQIYNLDQTKSDLNGELVTVQTKYLGAITKFVPFGEKTEEGYHIPYIIYKHLKTRKMLQKKSVLNQKTKIYELKTSWVPEFNIVELPQLTDEERADLKLKQAAANQVGA